MGREHEFGCKKCGAVVTIKVSPWSNRIDIKIEEGSARERSGELEILCKSCHRPVVDVLLNPKR